MNLQDIGEIIQHQPEIKCQLQSPSGHSRSRIWLRRGWERQHLLTAHPRAVIYFHDLPYWLDHAAEDINSSSGYLNVEYHCY